MLRQLLSTALFCTCCGCTVASPWKLDAIAAGDPSFTSARLIYEDPTSNPHLQLQFLRLGTAVELFLSLTQFPLSPSSSDPSKVIVQLQFDQEPPFEEPLSFLEGGMRLRFPENITSLITKALQDGKQVSILVDGFEGVVRPESFSKFYEKLGGSAPFFQNPFKGKAR